MNLRQRRRAVQASIARNNAWDWSFDRFIRAVVAAHNRMSKALEEAYARARERHDHTG